MKKRILSLCLSAVIALSLILPASAAAVEPYGTPWINSNVDGMVTEEITPNLKDDFYLAVNYDYLKDTPLKPGFSRIGTLADNADLLRERLDSLLTDESIPGREAELVREYYQMFLDWDSRGEKSREVLLSHLQPIQDIQTLEDLSEYLCTDECLYYGPSLIAYGSIVNVEDPSSYLLDVAATPLTLDDAAEYLEQSAYGQRLWTYCAGVARWMLQYFGYSGEEAEEIIQQALSFETAIASFIMTWEERQAEDAAVRTFNPRTMEQLEAESPAFPLAAKLRAGGYSPELPINLEEPAWLEGLNQLYTEDHLEEMKSYLLFQYVIYTINFADEASFREAQRLLQEFNGLSESPEDAVYANEATSYELWQFLDQMYVEKYCSETMKQDVLTLMEEVVEAYKEMLRKESWLTSETREKAIAKLDAIKLLSTYPDEDKWSDWSGVTFRTRAEGGSYAEAYYAIQRAMRELDRNRANRPVDREEWFVSTTDVNTSYSPERNRILIYAGMLDGDIYHEGMSREELMGGIGMLIAHEITHAFDATGSQYNEIGALESWWTDADRAAFQQRAQKLIDYYDTLRPWKDGTPCSGTMVQGEAIADLGGMACMLSIAEKIPDFDYDSFFRAYARLFQEKYTESSLENVYMLAGHPLSHLRINVVLAQFDEFQKTYDIQPGDGMYVAPADRIGVWGMSERTPGEDMSERFTDVPEDAWYAPAVRWAADAGIMNGTGKSEFKPDGTASRAMIATILWRMEGEKEAAVSPFTDVKAGSWYEQAVNWAAETGVVKGTSDTAFAPDAPITREQLAAMLFRYAGQKGLDVSGRGDLGGFADADTVSRYARDAMAWAVDAGLIRGKGKDSLAPKKNATRAEIATVMLRFDALART